MTGKENDVDVDDTMFDLAKGVLLQDGSASMGQDPKKYHMNPYEKLLMRVYIYAFHEYHSLYPEPYCRIWRFILVPQNLDGFQASPRQNLNGHICHPSLTARCHICCAINYASLYSLFCVCLDVCHDWICLVVLCHSLLKRCPLLGCYRWSRVNRFPCLTAWTFPLASFISFIVGCIKFYLQNFDWF